MYCNLNLCGDLLNFQSGPIFHVIMFNLTIAMYEYIKFQFIGIYEYIKFQFQ